MKKLISLIKACMTSDMNLFKIKTKNKKFSILLPIILAIYLMFTIGASSYQMFEKLAPLHLEYIILSLFIFGTFFITLTEGVYKASSLIFNCKDDNLLLSLPIKRRTVLFVRIFKFYIFELLFNSIFMLPAMVVYVIFIKSISVTYIILSIIMLLTLPIIPIIISCFIGAITSSLSSKFKYKNLVEIITAIVLLLFIFALSFKMSDFIKHLAKNATSLNDLITKIYYPAGVYVKLIAEFNIIDLLIYILVNIILCIISIYVLSKFYFKINSRLKSVGTTNKVNVSNLTIRSKSKTKSLVKKELNTFFKTPVFIVNSGFGLIMFMIFVFALVFKFDSLIPFVTNKETGLGISKDLIMNNLSILILALILITGYMTSITNSVISLEGRSINILKSLPVKVETILMSKIYACLIITTPILLIGNIILFIKFKISIIESILLLLLLVLVPLVSHFIGILVNLRYPKLDADNATEIVKQSTSSLVSVMLGIIFAIINIGIIYAAINHISSILLLIIEVIVYIIIDIILYLCLINKGTKRFNKLSV